MDRENCLSKMCCNLHRPGAFSILEPAPVEGSEHTVLFNRFQEIEGCAHVVALHGKFRGGGDKDDPAAMIRPPDPLRRLHPGDAIHVDIKEDEIILSGRKRAQKLFPAGKTVHCPPLKPMLFRICINKSDKPVRIRLSVIDDRYVHVRSLL